MSSGLHLSKPSSTSTSTFTRAITVLPWSCACQDEVKQYLDARYVAQCEAFWCTIAYEMHYISPAVYYLDIHLLGMQNVTWNEDATETINKIAEHAIAKNTTLTAWFKANAEYEDAYNVYYQDFPTQICILQAIQ